MWAREVGKMVGVSIPLYAAEHMHLTTNPIEGTYKGMPYLRDMDGYIYIKEEMGGLLMGGFEPVAKPWGMERNSGGNLPILSCRRTGINARSSCTTRSSACPLLRMLKSTA